MGGNPWAAEIGRFVALLAGALVLGQLAGHPLEALLVAALAYAASLLLQLHRLERWIRAGKKSHPPPARGIWSELYQQVHRLHLRARKRKRKLANALKRLRQSVAAFPDAAVILDGEDGIEWFNAGAGRLLGLKMPEDLGQRVTNLVRHPLFQDFLEGRGEPGAIEIPSPEDEHLVLSITLIRYGADQRLLLARDVSHLARLEQVRRDFVANVSHELRTPVTAIQGYAETLLSADADAATRERFLTIIHRHAQRLGRLLEDLLKLSAIEAQAPETAVREPVPLRPLAMLVAQTVDERRRGKEATVDIDVPEEAIALGDPAGLEQVLENLVDNALKYGPPGVTVRVVARRAGDGVEVAIEDTGPGIAAEHLPRLFERFYRVDPARSRDEGGAGLGLAIVKHLVESMNGSVTAESEIGKGSRFVVTLPAAAAPSGREGSPVTGGD